MPNTSGQSEPFVKRVEMAIMQYVIVSKAKEGEVTRENLKQLFRGNLQMSGDHFDHCITTLVQDGHLKEVGGNKFTATDDGREDVQKLQTLVMELPTAIGAGQQTQRQGITQQKSATGGNVGGGSTSGGNVGGGNVGGASTGQTQGDQGNFGSNKR